MDFIGRCGTYQYLDMDQVINQSLANVERWKEKFASYTGIASD
jgi:UDP-galactopyranose mutase